MNFVKYFITNTLLKIIFTLSFFLLIFISSITYKHSHLLTQSPDWVIHSYKTNAEIEKMLFYLKDAETAQRGYLLTSDTNLLQPYKSAGIKTYKSYKELIKLNGTNIQQQNNLESLYRLIKSRFKHLEYSLKLNDQIPFNQNLFNDNIRQGTNEMDSINFLANKMIELEMTILKERNAVYEHETIFTPLVTLYFSFFSLMLLVISFWIINNDLNALKSANASLLIKNESITHAEEIGEFSTWQWNLETNKLVYSDNQYRLLGQRPQSFEPTIENFLQFVHPNDKHIITEGTNQVIKETKYPEAYFRIIRSDGEVRFFKSISKLIIDHSGKKILIGINSDITNQQLNSLALEDRNQELERSIKELSSFNHVASHDLQELLRKIQIYISRLRDNEIELMTANGKDYIGKIKIAVTKMRMLIDALLLFSRTNKIEKIFEQTDLNTLLENTKQDLAQAIEEKNIIVQSTQLPIANVIPFQVQQLFTNLISNSIKYSKPNDIPLIKIDCEIIRAQEIAELTLDNENKYYKISFHDNGIGFEQKYAENIFILFNRLHHEKEYAGTGIGLSICKKIVENHSGYIFAQGQPNIGASFFVYIPV